MFYESIYILPIGYETGPIRFNNRYITMNSDQLQTKVVANDE